MVEGDKPGKLDRARLLEQVSHKGDAPWPALSNGSMVITGTTPNSWRSSWELVPTYDHNHEHDMLQALLRCTHCLQLADISFLSTDRSCMLLLLHACMLLRSSNCWQQLTSVTTLQVPKTPGIYVWCARAPDAGHSQWFAVYLGKANKLRDRLGAYINSDGTFGPQKEAHKLGVLKEMYEKGFDFQIRWVVEAGRPAMPSTSAGQQRAANVAQPPLRYSIVLEACTRKCWGMGQQPVNTRPHSNSYMPYGLTAACRCWGEASESIQKHATAAYQHTVTTSLLQHASLTDCSTPCAAYCHAGGEASGSVPLQLTRLTSLPSTTSL